jgi:hypothetical protein
VESAYNIVHLNVLSMAEFITALRRTGAAHDQFSCVDKNKEVNRDKKNGGDVYLIEVQVLYI